MIPAELEPYARRWQITYPAGLGIYAAERREPGGALRYIVGRSPAELAGKLGAAEEAALTEAGQHAAGEQRKGGERQTG